MSLRYSVSVVCALFVFTACPICAQSFLNIQSLTGGVAGEFQGTIGSVDVDGEVLSAAAGFGFSGVGTDGTYFLARIDNTSPQYSFASTYTPTQPLGDQVGYLALGADTVIQLTFSRAIQDPTFHVGNLDGSILDFSQSLLTAADIEIVNSNGNLTELPDGRIEGGAVVPFDATQDPINALSGYGSISLSGTFTQLTFRFTESVGDGGTFTLSAEPSPLTLGDVDLNGVVNFLDISPFISVLSSGGFQAEADIDQNGSVNFLDISPFIAILSGP